jgi:hypothetical protein
VSDDPLANEQVAPMKRRKNVKHQPDPIRIVPLHGGTANGAATPAARLTYRKGPLIRSVQVFTIFWGPQWKNADQAQLAGRINGFFDSILTSTLIDELAEYNVGGYKISYGKRVGTVTITTPALRTSVTDAAIQKMLRQLVTSRKGVPAPSVNTLYFVYVQPGVRVVQGGAASCQAFCGYHSAIDAQFFYAVMPYPGCNGCTGGLSVFDSLTSTSSHELCEAITDPVPGEGWYDDTYGEVGDICAWETKQVSGFTVQLEWSNRNKRCV